MTTSTVMVAEIQKVTTIEAVMEWCEIGKKAYSVIEKLKFFLKTKEDIINFIVKFEDRFMYLSQKGGLDWTGLAKEVGSYHHEYASYEQLQNMDEREALERLFNEPINDVKLEAFRASKATFRELFELKQGKPSQHFSTSLIYF